MCFEQEVAKRHYSQLNLFRGGTELASSLASVASLRELTDGEVLIEQDAEDTDLFFVLSGSLKVKANGRLVAIRSAGTHVGEMALIDPRARRSATVVAAEKSVVAKVTEPQFQSLANERSELWRRLSIELCERLRNRNRFMRPPNEVPNVFICSSSENLAYAKGIQLGLDHLPSNVKVWTDQVFGPMKQTMEDLEREVQSADFAVAIMMDEDVTESRESQQSSPRDNVVFELGLFMGQMGRERTIVVTPRGVELKLPSDLLGLNPITFAKPADGFDQGQLATALAPVCTQLKSHIKRLGPR